MRRILAALLFLAPISVQATELYIGAFGTATFLDATVRRPMGTTTDAGGDGFGGGLRAGAGWRPVNRLYIGAEAEGIVQFDTVSRVQALNYTQSIYGAAALYGRVGYEWPDRGMVFLRAGGAWVNASRGDYTTPTIGGGLEIYLSPRWSLRADATYYWPNGTDNIEQVVLTGGLSLKF
jgi:Outer membrane protein beta-barrel domain